MHYHPRLYADRTNRLSRQILAFVVSGSVLFAMPASADLEQWWNARSPESESGLYAGLSGSVGVAVGLDDHVKITSFNLQDPPGSPPPSNREPNPSVDAGVGLHARLGYRFHPHLAAEGQFEWISEWSIKGKDSERANPRFQSDFAKGEAWTATANLKFYLLTGSVQPYLIAGVGLMRFQGDNRSPIPPATGSPIIETNIDGARDVGFAFRTGGGMDVMITDHMSFVLGATYVVTEGDVDPYDYLSIEWGVQYRF
jgi:opacity protein-like surface antigen